MWKVLRFARWSSAVLLTATAAALPKPTEVLRSRQLIRSADFVLAHASYQLVRVHWVRPDVTLNALYLNEARTATEAGQVRSIVWSAPLTSSGRLSLGNRRALLEASRVTATACLNLHLEKLESRLAATVARAAARPGLTLNFGSAQTFTVAPADTGDHLDVSIELHLPPGQRPLCTMPSGNRSQQ